MSLRLLTAQAALRGCRVHANDLNPYSAHYLRENARANGVAELVSVYCLDAREFLKAVLSPVESGETLAAPLSMAWRRFCASAGMIEPVVGWAHPYLHRPSLGSH